jgi:thiamine-phosphate pyrophosphorylase
VAAPDFDVYLVTDRGQTRGRDLLWVIDEAVKGGIRAVQLREKDLEGGELFDLAEKVAALCRHHRAALLINDRVDVALAVDATGVQLGKRSLPIAAARALLGDDKWIGASIHSVTEVEAAEKDGADFLLFGPVYFTPSKAVYGAPQGVGALKEIVALSRLPVYAIGGVTAQNIRELLDAGARGIAGISSIVSAPEPRHAARELIDLMRH